MTNCFQSYFDKFPIMIINFFMTLAGLFKKCFVLGSSNGIQWIGNRFDAAHSSRININQTLRLSKSSNKFLVARKVGGGETSYLSSRNEMIEKRFDYRVRYDTHLGSAYINQTFPIYPFSQYPTGNEMGVSLFSCNLESSRQLQMATAMMGSPKKQ